MNRRNFLKGSAALFAAPAIVKAENIMKIWTPPDAGKIMTASEVLERQMHYHAQFNTHFMCWEQNVTVPIFDNMWHIAQMIAHNPTNQDRLDFMNQAKIAFESKEGQIINARTRRL